MRFLYSLALSAPLSLLLTATAAACGVDGVDGWY